MNVLTTVELGLTRLFLRIALLDEWIKSQRLLLEQTNADLEQLRRLQRDPLNTTVALNPLPNSPPELPWDWAAFDGRDSAPFLAFHHKPFTTGPRPLSQFVHNAKAALLNPLFEKWDMDWDPAPLPSRKDPIAKKTAQGLGRSVVSYLTQDHAAEAVDVDIDMDMDIPQPLPLPPTPTPTYPTKSIAEAIKPPEPKPRAKKKRKREPSRSPSPSQDSVLHSPHPTHATKEVHSSSKPPKARSDTFKQSWSESEQNLLERLLDQFPEGEKNRWKKISLAMDNRRTPRQVASRVQKYFAKLKKFGLG